MSCGTLPINGCKVQHHHTKAVRLWNSPPYVAGPLRPHLPLWLLCLRLSSATAPHPTGRHTPHDTALRTQLTRCVIAPFCGCLPVDEAQRRTLRRAGGPHARAGAHQAGGEGPPADLASWGVLSRQTLRDICTDSQCRGMLRLSGRLRTLHQRTCMTHPAPRLPLAMLP